jgi:enolase-phosphatase E1
VSASLESRDIAGVVLDIEGTTTPVSFVSDVLFPYARERVGRYIASNIENSDVSETMQLLRAEWSEDLQRGEPVPEWPAATRGAASAITHYLVWLMDRDRKSTALKTIQGRIWEAGFRDGTLRGEVFDDVPRAFSRWRNAGVGISIYSSGSALAQRLLFGHSVAGDLTPCIAQYFDTTVGAKREASSYTRIASAIGQAPGRLLFISDVPEELDAADAVGFQTTLCVRGAEPHVSNEHHIIRSFDEVT